MATSTDKWLASVPELPALTGGAHSTAERLLLLLHYGIDWESGWVASRRAVYWEHHLPDRVRLATYRCGADLDRWWGIVSEKLESRPNASQRLELSQLLREPPKPVLTIMRESTRALVLRTQIVATAYRESQTHTRRRRDNAGETSP